MNRIKKSSNKKMAKPQIEYRLYGHPNCTLFSMISEKEVGQSKGLGYVLSQSGKAVKFLVELIKKNGGSVPNLTIKQCNIIIDCELRQKLNENESYRADILIRFFDKNRNPIYAILIETKSKGKNITDENAKRQLKDYVDNFEELQVFKDEEEKKISLLTLTDVKTKFQNTENSYFITTLTWGELVEKFERIKEPLVQDFINYLLKINGNMKQYDKEILSIPAGNTYKLVSKTKIYCCPVGGKYNARAQSHPLYLAFRKKGSIMEELYKVRDILELTRPVVDDIKPFLKNTYGDEVLRNIEDWDPKEGQPAELSYVFLLDGDNTIQLPKKVKLNYKCQQHSELSFRDVFNPNSPGSKCIEISK